MSGLRRKATVVAREMRAFRRYVGARRQFYRLRHAWNDKAKFARAYFGDVDAARRREADELWEIRAREPVLVRQPLVLISGVEHAGGTFLSRLFDSHPQCHVTPPHCAFAEPVRGAWPRLDPAAGPETWFAQLAGSSREAATSDRVDAGETSPPHMLLPTLRKDIFVRCLADVASPSSRDIVNAFVTACFNAWLDNQNLYHPDKRIVVASVPGLAADAPSVDEFFRTYPDGWLISIVRDPRTWVVSAMSHDRHAFPDVTAALQTWNRSTQGIVEARKQYGSRVEVVRHEHLVRATEPTMRRLASVVGIDFHPCLTCPTFNGVAVAPTSLTRDAISLTAEQRELVEAETRAARAAVAPFLS